MRKKDREVSNMEDIISIMKKCDSCNLAFFDDEYPYVIPVNFGFTYDGSNMVLHFHGAGAGKKISLIEKNPKVGFDMSCSHDLVTAEDGSYCTMLYESVCGNGSIEILKDDQKVNALTQIMKQYSKAESFDFSENALNAVTVYQLKVNQITGKRYNRS